MMASMPETPLPPNTPPPPDNNTAPPAAPVAERELPPWAPWLMAVVGIAVLTAFFLFATKEPPSASGKITKVFAVEQTGTERVLVGVEVLIRNETEKELLTRDVGLKLKAAGQEFTDTAAASGELDRYYQAYPQFKQSDFGPLAFETKIPRYGSTEGVLVFGFPISKEMFDARESLELNIKLYGRKPLILTEQQEPPK
jgi:hypothetical protein